MLLIIVIVISLKQSLPNDHACSKKTKIQGTIQHGLQGTGCVSHTVYLAHGNSKSEARGRNKHKNNAIVRNLEERNVGMRGKILKQGLTSAKDLPMELSERLESPDHRLD